MKDCTKNTNWKNALLKSMETTKKNSIKFRISYGNNPKKCNYCGNILLFEKRSNKFCNSSCAAKCNNVVFPKRKMKKINKQKLKNICRIIRNTNNKTIFEKQCIGCKVLFLTINKKVIYCSQKCRGKKIRFDIFKLIESGNTKLPAKNYRNYLIAKFDMRCMLCGWNECNKLTNQCPIELDHIDGNSENNNLINLRLVCPNCHALQPTYKGLNKGNGRFSRRQRYRNGKSY